MTKPIAILISDIHFTVSTLEEATIAFKAAANDAYNANVPLIIAGDLTDGKALMRAEVTNRLCRLMQDYFLSIPIYVLVGNHDLINEKGEENALDFLRPHCKVIDRTTKLPGIGYLIPYQNDSQKLLQILSTIPEGSTLIMHQGVVGADLGHYVQDKTSLPPEAFSKFRVISGHYHKSQDIPCGDNLFSYLGNPYTLNFGEANHPPKGFSVLYSDGSLERNELPIRKHTVIEMHTDDDLPSVDETDILWFKITGPKSDLSKVKNALSGHLGHSNFKLDLIPSDSEKLEAPAKNLTGTQLFDILIDNLPESDDYKKRLKNTWRTIV